MVRTIAGLMLLASTGGAVAQEIPFSADATETCLAGQRDPEGRAACIGRSAAACHQKMTDRTEEDAAACLNAETEWWRGRMQAAYERVETRAALLDVEFATAISQGGARMTDDLAAMQAAWKDWSEKRCFFAAVEHRGKPDRTEVASDCVLHATADQALLLETAAEKRKGLR